VGAEGDLEPVLCGGGEGWAGAEAERFGGDEDGNVGDGGEVEGVAGAGVDDCVAGEDGSCVEDAVGQVGDADLAQLSPRPQLAGRR
jgi:hypothetical protein